MASPGTIRRNSAKFTHFAPILLEKRGPKGVPKRSLWGPTAVLAKSFPGPPGCGEGPVCCAPPMPSRKENPARETHAAKRTFVGPASPNDFPRPSPTPGNHRAAQVPARNEPINVIESEAINVTKSLLVISKALYTRGRKTPEGARIGAFSRNLECCEMQLNLFHFRAYKKFYFFGKVQIWVRFLAPKSAPSGKSDLTGLPL